MKKNFKRLLTKARFNSGNNSKFLPKSIGQIGSDVRPPITNNKIENRKGKFEKENSLNCGICDLQNEKPKKLVVCKYTIRD